MFSTFVNKPSSTLFPSNPIFSAIDRLRSHQAQLNSTALAFSINPPLPNSVRPNDLSISHILTKSFLFVFFITKVIHMCIFTSYGGSFMLPLGSWYCYGPLFPTCHFLYKLPSFLQCLAEV